MSRICRQCDKPKEACVSCGSKDLYYCCECNKHKTMKLFRKQIYCRDCIVGNVCGCSEDYIYTCPTCHKLMTKCAKCGQFPPVIQSDNNPLPSCQTCFNQNQCQDCQRHIVTYKCYICDGKVCRPCRAATTIDVSPMTLYPNQIMPAIARRVYGCATCMQTHTIYDVQEMYRNLEHDNGDVVNNDIFADGGGNNNNNIHFEEHPEE
jgi:hypothetical protein